jgi:hypothetical protein
MVRRDTSGQEISTDIAAIAGKIEMIAKSSPVKVLRLAKV